jgi:hypothetical protein
MTYLPPRRDARVRPFVLGAGASLAGHVATIVAMYAAGRLIGGGQDLDAGGRFAVAVTSIFALGVAQALLLAVAVPIGVNALERRPPYGAGLLSGWLLGFLTLIVLAGMLFYNAGRA